MRIRKVWFLYLCEDDACNGTPFRLQTRVFLLWFGALLLRELRISLFADSPWP